MSKLEDRLARLEQALPASPGRSPHREEFERRVKISDLYMEWVSGDTEKPELSDPRDREEWERMEAIMSIAKKIALRRAEAKGSTRRRIGGTLTRKSSSGCRIEPALPDPRPGGPPCPSG